MSGRRPRRPATIAIVLVVAVALALIAIAVLITLTGGLPSAADCQANPNLLGC